VADNVLWGGLVSGVRSGPAGPSASTSALRAFDREVLADPRFEGTILPVGDGLLVAAYTGSAGTAEAAP
jgi:predicted O-methyltransferase YrrM